MKCLSFVLLVLLSLSACAPIPQATLASVIETATITPSPILTPTLTLTPTLPPTLLIPTNTPTITPTFSPIRSTPPTIMLHRSNNDFDSVQFLKDMIAIIKQNDLKVITYQDIYKDPAITAVEKGHLFIITIDDIYLRYPIHPSILEMIQLLREAGYPAVLGIITESDYAYPETATLLKELSDSGWEIASHTNTHANLGQMEKRKPRYVFIEVSASMDKIEKVTGIRPITLILPEGQMVDDAKFIKRAKIVWAVGINEGITYNSQRDFIYVGRQGPSVNAEQTFKVLKKRFGF